MERVILMEFLDERNCSIEQYLYSNQEAIDRSFSTKNRLTGFVTALRVLCIVKPIYDIIESHQCENSCMICCLKSILESRMKDNSSLDCEIDKFKENFNEVIEEKATEKILAYILTDKAFDTLNNKKCGLRLEISLDHGRKIGKMLIADQGFLLMDVDDLFIPIPDYSILYHTLRTRTKIRNTQFLGSRQSLLNNITKNVKNTLSTHKYLRNIDNVDILFTNLTASIAPELLIIKIKWDSIVPTLHQIFQLLILLPDKINITVDSNQITYGLKLLLVSKDSSFLIAHDDFWVKIENDSRLLIGNGQWYENLLFILRSRQIPVMMFYQKDYPQNFELTDNQLVLLETISLKLFEDIDEDMYNLIINPDNDEHEDIKNTQCTYCKRLKPLNQAKCLGCGFSLTPWKCSNGHQNWAFMIGCEECEEIKLEIAAYRSTQYDRILEEDKISQCRICQKRIRPYRNIFIDLSDICKSCFIRFTQNEVQIYV